MGLESTGVDGRAYLLTMFPVRNVVDQVEEVGCLFLDVSDRVSAERALAVSERRREILATMLQAEEVERRWPTCALPAARSPSTPSRARGRGCAPPSRPSFRLPGRSSYPKGWEQLPRKRGVRVLRIAGTFRVHPPITRA